MSDEDVPPWAAWLPALVALLCASPALMGAFVLDDAIAVQSSACVTGRVDVLEVFGRSFWCESAEGPLTTAAWRPLPVLVWRAAWWLGGGSPLPFHALCAVLHASCASLVFRLGQAIGMKWRGALVGAIAFAGLAMHAEVMASIVGAAASLCAAFTLLVLLTMLRDAWRFPVRLVAVALFAGLACLSREDGIVVMPLAWLAVFAFPPAPEATDIAARRRHRIGLAVATTIVAGAVVLWRANVLGAWTASTVPAHVNPMVALDPVARIKSAFGLVGRYHLVLVAGRPLAADYAFDAIPVGADMAWWQAALGAACVGGWLGLAGAARERPALWLPALWWLGGLALVANALVITPALFAERMVYPASVGPCLLLGSGFDRAWNSERWRTVAGVGLLAWCLAQASQASVHAWRWADQRRLLEHTAAMVPRNARARTWAAEAALRDFDPSAAFEHATAATKIRPDDPLAHALRAAALDQLGQPEAAVEAFRQAMTLAPADAQVADLFIQFLLRYGHVPQANLVYGAHAQARGGAPDPSVTRPPPVRPH